MQAGQLPQNSKAVFMMTGCWLSFLLVNTPGLVFGLVGCQGREEERFLRMPIQDGVHMVHCSIRAIGCHECRERIQ